MTRRINSVIEIAKYRVGDLAYWVTIRPLEQMPSIPIEDAWMLNHHPKFMYTRGPAKQLWPYRKNLPKLHHSDFEGIVNMLRSKVVVEEFPICEVVRCRNTGEFFYSNSDDEWMPESYLFDTDTAAIRERNRVVQMIRNWAND